MAELCRKCFIEIWHPTQKDIGNIVMSEDEAPCEGCNSWGKYVDHIGCSNDVSTMMFGSDTVNQIYGRQSF